MPLRRYNSQSIHRTIYSGETQTITLLKRENDLKEGTVVALTLYECFVDNPIKTGQPIESNETVNHKVLWIVPNSQLRRVGVNYINVIDRIVDNLGQFWQPESDQNIILSQFDNYTLVNCVRIDPSPNEIKVGILEFQQGAVVVPIEN